MTSMRPGALGSKTTPGTPHMTDDTPHDSIPHHRDPAADRPLDEATSAADADWLAALRATAKERNASLADVVADIETDLDADDEIDLGSAVDESTIGSPTALDDIRRIARAERERAAAAVQPNVVDTRRQLAADHDPEPQVSRSPSNQPVRSAPAGAGLRSVARPDIPAAPPVLGTGRPDRGSDRIEPADKAAQVAPRWEAPPRLEAAANSSEPAFLDRNGSQSRADWRITALAVAVALLLGIVLSLLFLNNDVPTDPLENDPDGTTVVDGSVTNGDSVTNDSIINDAGQLEDGS